MKHDPDLLRAARHLIDTYGDRAAEVAERRAANLLKENSEAIAKLWQHIARIVRAIQAGRA